MIDPVLRAKATPIAPFDLPAALSSSNRRSSSGIHGLLLFLGCALTIEKGLLNTVMIKRFLRPLCRSAEQDLSRCVAYCSTFGDGDEYLTSSY
jgi:hypothetical protein